jgi:hypothetical protein
MPAWGGGGESASYSRETTLDAFVFRRSLALQVELEPNPLKGGIMAKKFHNAFQFYHALSRDESLSNRICLSVLFVFAERLFKFGGGGAGLYQQF